MIQIKKSFQQGVKKSLIEKNNSQSFAQETGGVLDSQKVCPILTGSWRSATPIVDKNKCVGCGTCVEFCPEACLEVKEKRKEKKVTVDYDFCKGCGICSQVCPFGAIKMKE